MCQPVGDARNVSQVTHKDCTIPSSPKRVEPSDEPTPLPWVLPLRMINPSGVEVALLLAIWTVANEADKWPSYAAQVTAAIDAWATELRAEHVILAGDTNCSAQGPSSAPHSANIRRLDELGVRSAYHAHHDLEHGEETDMTLRWIGPGRREYRYHCDFVFLSAPLDSHMESASVGGMAEWVESELLDHAPLVVGITSAT